jgi:hypothetical protein
LGRWISENGGGEFSVWAIVGLARGFPSLLTVTEGAADFIGGSTGGFVVVEISKEDIVFPELEESTAIAIGGEGLLET